MANSSLYRTGEEPPEVSKGHGTDALGPSDLSDTGSDTTGAPGLNEEGDTLPLQPGTTSDADRNRPGRRKTAGPDIGDENLDSDTDAGGTGERKAAGRDAPRATDQQLNIVDASGAELLSDEDLENELLVDEDGNAGSDDEFDLDEATGGPRGTRSATNATPAPNTKTKTRSGAARPRAGSRGKR